jgi:hypothetical protein
MLIFFVMLVVLLQTGGDAQVYLIRFLKLQQRLARLLWPFAGAFLPRIAAGERSAE